MLCLDPRINGTKSEGGPANLKKGCCRSSAAVALCAGSLTNNLSKKPCSLGEIYNVNVK